MLQARGFDSYRDTSYTPPKVTQVIEEEVPAVEHFPYGWRYVMKLLPTGEEIYEQIPLTLDDLLNPQLGDQMPQRNEHFDAIVDLVASLKTYYADDSSMGVFGDLIMDWGIPGISNPAPDIAFIPNVTDKKKSRGTFDVIFEGTRPCLVIEVMSPRYPGDDTKKVTIYEQAGVMEYFLIKPLTEQGEICYELFGYRLQSGVYRRVPLDEQGRLLSQTLQLWFGTEDLGRKLRVTDVRTGQPFLTQLETEVVRRQEQVARLEAEARAEAEAQARKQTEATRMAAEARAEAEAEARKQAEAQAKALEKRLQELEALLKSRS